MLYKHTTCIPCWNNMETVVSTPFQRGMFVGKTIRPKINFQTFSIPLPNLLILPVPICTIVSQAHEIIFFFLKKIVIFHIKILCQQQKRQPKNLTYLRMQSFAWKIRLIIQNAWEKLNSMPVTVNNNINIYCF